MEWQDESTTHIGILAGLSKCLWQLTLCWVHFAYFTIPYRWHLRQFTLSVSGGVRHDAASGQK